MSKLLIERAVVINEFIIFRKLINGMAKKFKLVAKIYSIYWRKINLRFSSPKRSKLMKDDEANKNIFFNSAKKYLKNKQQRYLFDLHHKFVYLFGFLF
jgi:hypothetical protein